MKCPNCKIDLVECSDFLKCQKCTYNILKNEDVVCTLYILFGVDLNGVENLMALPTEHGVHQTIIHADYETVLRAYKKAIELLPHTKFIIKKFTYLETMKESCQ